ncbi:pilus assembly PilX family protein [Noviherbaspirillum galbum]|uniref:Pilus assembly protein PilX n=1 Tax=Noviherbaspirillum galbum TaxID=2709383 RepID=A0A6B3SHA4_9BURK|nr:PilX N-terminal domain-containing pilus assembly protein [Noviherbaspirillum galbum]NEX60251.1 pilus assembly protein PilX [Noviherbaspirillum galbum]
MSRHHTTSQQGATLIVTLFMLVLVMLLGASAARLALQDERAARADRDRQLAMQAAEAALRDAEAAIELAKGAITGALAGTDDDPPAWAALALEGPAAGSSEFGSMTGQSLQTGNGMPSRLPRYIIEHLPDNRPGTAADIAKAATVYRVTAIGYGAGEHTRVMLQSIYRRAGGA